MSGNNEGSTPEFDEFLASGEVEVGDTNLASQENEQPKKAAPKAAAKEPAPVDDQQADEQDEDEGTDDQQDDEQDEDEKPKKTARDHQIERLKREKSELARQLREASNSELSRRLENLEKSLQSGNSGSNSSDQGNPAPDPTDTELYPLGHLDDRYIEDKLEWLAEKKAAERADAVLQRQQENERSTAAQREQQELLGKVDDLATRGSDIYEDFQESVVEAGMRGDWDLSQATFEAAHEANNGAQILYELSQDKKEATRVAKLSSYQQLKYVQERDAEIGKGKTPRRIPRAGEPPKNIARGANSRTQINPATENLDDFEKAWELDAKRGNR